MLPGTSRLARLAAIVARAAALAPLVALTALVACSSSSDSGSGDGLVATSTSGTLKATLHPSSDSPPLGDQAVALDLVYIDGGAPATGLALTVVPWMPAMQHGTSIIPTVSETSPGTYTIANAYLFMPGVWEMRTSVATSADAGAVDTVAPSLDVP
jgi:hypothetical protein